MKYEIAKYDFEGHEIPTLINNETGDPWWIAKDVCRALEIKNTTQAVDSLDEDERSMYYIGRQGEVNIINEPGLYSLILRSRKSEAKRFKRWVTHEVLPSIRKHGGYIHATDDMSDAEIMAKAVLVAQATIEKQKECLRVLEPKGVAYDQFMNREGLLTFKETAKMLCVGPIKLIRSLKKKGVLYNHPVNGNPNLPIQRFIDNGWFVVKDSVNYNTGWTGTQTFVTRKGAEGIRKNIEAGKLVIK